ncbi:hypothetical protein FKM82_027795 [Ascaphus truei]
MAIPAPLHTIGPFPDILPFWGWPSGDGKSHLQVGCGGKGDTMFQISRGKELGTHHSTPQGLQAPAIKPRCTDRANSGVYEPFILAPHVFYGKVAIFPYLIMRLYLWHHVSGTGIHEKSLHP